MEISQIPILLPMSQEEFWGKLRELVKSELLRTLKEKNEQITYEVSGLTQKPLYKANEVCSLLHISRQTLNAWQKEGILKPLKIKSRVYFLWSDIEKLITKE